METLNRPDPEHPVSDRVRHWGVVSWSIIGIVVLTVGALWALAQVRDIFPPLVLALVTIYLLNPIVSRLERRGISRVFGSCLTYTFFIALVALAFAFLVPLAIEQGRGFVHDFPRNADRIQDFAERASADIERRFGGQIKLRDRIAGGGSGLLGDVLKRAGSFLQGALHTFVLLALGPIIAFYLLVDLPRLKRSVLNLVPPRRRPEVVEVASEVGRAMGGFFRGQLFVALVVGIMSALGLRLIGLPYWLVVGLIAGFFNIVPLIGPFIGAIPGILIAGALRPPITILFVVIVMTVVQQIDNHFISPNVMRLTVKLHPVTVMMSLIVGATLAGFWGMLLAVPLVASGKVVAGHLWYTRVPWGPEVFEEAEPPPEEQPLLKDPDEAPAAEDAGAPAGSMLTVSEQAPGDPAAPLADPADPRTP
ncbi:MAG TPA: AI-2E family transporter [Actinomycetota bacterium]|nr:AI-2E family transporter [Actinomycetota bacterium]